jgi:hypothetical protein
MESNTMNSNETATVEAQPEVTKTTEIRKNRKQRRFEAKLARRKDLQAGPNLRTTVQGMIRAMKESPRTVEAVTNGSLDKYLG